MGAVYDLQRWSNWYHVDLNDCVIVPYRVGRKRSLMIVVGNNYERAFALDYKPGKPNYPVPACKSWERAFDLD